MKEFWDDRYASDEYVYGKEPNEYFKSCLDKLSPGTVFLPGEGEGRNAVYAASRGWQVFAFDQSENGRRKALKLAGEKKVHIDYRIGSVLDIHPEKGMNDVIGLIYFHLWPEVRKRYHQYLVSTLTKGGIIVLEAFSKDQLNKGPHGPKDQKLLYTLDDIIMDFNELEVLHTFQGEVTLDEGLYHRGRADVVRFTGKK